MPKLISARALALAAVLAAGAAAAPASAATIVLHNLGGVEVGTQAYSGFMTAANFWAGEIANPITINLNVGFGHLAPNILGQTGSNGFYVPTALIEQQLAATGTSALDATAVAHLPTLSANGGITMVTPGYHSIDPVTGDGLGVDTTKSVLDNNDTFNNTNLSVNSADLKALGFTGFGNTADGSVTFSSDFNFDFNPTNGIGANQIDFVGVAIHEIGHALGFDSGVDLYDLIGSPNGLDASGHPQVCGVPCQNYDSEDDAFGTPLDLFRYNNGLLNWQPGVNAEFSVDGGATSMGCDFSSGQFNGDTWQASHWQRRGGSGGTFCGIMDPAVSFGQQDAVSALDFAALDAIGYNFTFGDNVPLSLTTAEIAREFGVPEPSAWALMILGFGLTGASMRRRSRQAAAG
jgi:hypothetical protein